MTQHQQKQLLTVRDVATVLSLGVSTIWRQVKKGNLPKPKKVGDSTRWRRADIDAVIAAEVD